MLKIRLQRVGKKHDPSFRVILTDVRQGPKSGKFIENLGFYDTIRKIKQIKGGRIKHWIANGAQVSDTVHNILIGEKIIEGKKINALPKKTPLKKKIEKTEGTEKEKETMTDKKELLKKPTEEIETIKEPNIKTEETSPKALTD